MVHNEQGRFGFTGSGGRDVETQGMEVMSFRIALKRNASGFGRRRNPSRVNPKGAMRIGVGERTHDRIPRLPTGVAGHDHVAVRDFTIEVERVPEARIFAEIHVMLCVITDNVALRGGRPIGIITRREVGIREKIVRDEITGAPENDTLVVT